MKKYASVDDYIRDASKAVQPLLKNIRGVIKAAAPGATEKISYGIPYYSLNGRLLYFAAFKNHISLYPMASGLTAFKKELAGYETSKGTVRFPLDKPLPDSLIQKIIEFRVKENLSRKK